MTALVTENLALLAGAPSGIVRIRQLIVDLAASGKLVTEVGAVAWPVVRLGALVTSFQNGVSSRGEPDGTFVTVLRLADIKNGEICLADVRQLPLDAQTSEKYRLADGDVLVIRVNGSADLVGRFIVHGDSDGALHCDHFIRLRVDRQRIDPRYLKVVGDSSQIRKAIQRLFVSTAGQKTVNQGHVGSLSTTLPPLAEQHRIVAKVDELMALCDRLEARQRDAEAAHAQLVQALLDSLTQAHDADEFEAGWQRLAGEFQRLFTTKVNVEALKQTALHAGTSGRFLTDAPSLVREPAPAPRYVEGDNNQPFPLPSTWRWVTLGTLCELVTSGSRGWKEFYADEGSTFIRSQDIKADRLEFDQRAYVKLPDTTEGTRTQVRNQDILITITGANVGKAAVLSQAPSDAYVSQHVALVRLRNPASADYLHRWLINSHGGRRLLLASSYGAKPGLNLQNIKDLPIPLPPMAEQHRIVAKVTELLTLCDQLKTRIAAARAKQAQLADALVAQAVAG